MPKRRRGSPSRRSAVAQPRRRSSGSSSGRWPASRRRSASTSPRSRSSSTTSRRPDQLRENDLDPDETLYGLYEGVPRTEYGADWVAAAEPDHAVPPAARGGLPRSRRPRRGGPDHGHPRARPSPRHRRRPARRARRRLAARRHPSARRQPGDRAERTPRTITPTIGQVSSRGGRAARTDRARRRSHRPVEARRVAGHLHEDEDLRGGDEGRDRHDQRADRHDAGEHDQDRHRRRRARCR